MHNSTYTQDWSYLPATWSGLYRLLLGYPGILMRRRELRREIKKAKRKESSQQRRRAILPGTSGVHSS
eukprot:907953-Amorphochlora_amoeboformis.AAC.1